MRHDEVYNEGEEIILVAGPYEGTPGAFLRLKADVRWADITERNGSVRSHPVAWFAHAAGNERAGTTWRRP